MEDYRIYPAIHVKIVPVMIYRDILHRFYSFFCLRYNAVTGASVLVHAARAITEDGLLRPVTFTVPANTHQC